MADIDLKTETPDTSLPATGFLFGADSQASASPSVYSVPVAAAALLSNAPNGSAAAPSFAMGTTGLYTRAITARLNFTINGFDTGVEIGPTTIALQNTSSVSWVSSTLPSSSQDLFLTRRGAANLRLGAADAAAPVAQTLSVQSVVAGTTDTAGTNLTITGSQGTGTGAGGSLIFQVAPAGSSGMAQNALATRLQVSASGFGVTVTSNLKVNNNIELTGGNANIYVPNSNLTLGDLSGQYAVAISGAANAGVTLGSSGVFRWTNGTSYAGTADLFLYRDAANTLALRNAAAAQRFNVYNTWSSTTNYEAFKIDWITTANTVLVGTEKGSGGGNARDLAFQTDGTTRLTINATTGSAVFTGSVTSSGVAIGTNVAIPAAGFVTWSGRAAIASPADKVVKIVDNAGTGPSALQAGQFTVANLPAAATYAGSMAFVSDATATTARSTVAGGGANKVMVMSDGTNWLIVA
jgi:hypothetical protein